MLHSLNKYFNRNRSLPGKFSGKVKERLLEVVIALCWYLVVLEILLPVESDLLGLNLPVLHVNLISTKNNWNVFTDPAKVHTTEPWDWRNQGKSIKQNHHQTTKDDWYIILPAKITMPCWNILVCQTGSNIKHDNCTLPMNAARQTLSNVSTQKKGA